MCDLLCAQKALGVAKVLPRRMSFWRMGENIVLTGKAEPPPLLGGPLVQRPAQQ